MSNWFKLDQPSLIGIDISSTAVKALELSNKNGRFHVESFGVAPLPPKAVIENDIKDIKATADAIALAVQRSGSSAKCAAIAMPNSAVITKVIQMDSSLSEEDIETQIYLDAATKYISFPLEDIKIDFSILGPSTNNRDCVDVLLVASRNEHVDARTAAIESAGLTTKIVDVESYAIERTCPLIKHQLSSEQHNNLIAVVDIGATMTTLTVLHNFTTIYSREEIFGGQQLTEAIQNHYGLTFQEAGIAKKQGGLADDYIVEILDPYKESLAPLIRRSLQFFFSASRYDSVDHILLAGGGSLIPDIVDLIQEKLGYPTSIANPFSNMSISPNVDPAALRADSSALMVACGLALRRENTNARY